MMPKTATRNILFRDLTGSAGQTRNAGFAVICASAISAGYGVSTLEGGLGVLFISYALIGCVVALRLNSVAVSKQTKTTKGL
jgi:hypothetical protein